MANSQQIIIVSVNQATLKNLQNILAKLNLNYYLLSYLDCKTYLHKNISTTIGIDIVLPVIAIQKEYLLKDFWVVNSGTATTLCQVEDYQVINYKIIPGFELMKKSLVSLNSALENNPRVIDGICQVQNSFTQGCDPLFAVGGNYNQFTHATYYDEFLVLKSAYYSFTLS